MFAAHAQQQITDATITFNFIEKGVDGKVSGFTSTASVNWEHLDKFKLSGTVDVNTLKTGNFLRDWSLKGKSYFNVDEYPNMSFSSTKLTMQDSNLKVTGNLTIKGITKTIELTFIKDGNTLKGTTTLFSSDFDITILKKGRESNKVLVNFEFILD